MKRFLILIAWLYPYLLHNQEYQFNFIIWNVGQGSWSTFIEFDTCYHIDAGGEFAPWSPILELCKNRKNHILLTHTDWDHINQIRKLDRHSHRICLAPHNLLKTNDPMSQWLSKIPTCKKPYSTSIKRIFKPLSFKTRNEASHIYLIKNQFVIAGDSYKKQEKKWAQQLPKKPLFILLGHHGSQTSTSSQLLGSRHFKTAFTSSRKKRYGHPHHKVIERLKTHNIPLMTTEAWGNIYLQL